jgi:HD-GYP domain-containing protein (c-di-GMP phosphodiesterase class II)
MGEALHFDDDAIKELELAGLMHDIGKITIPDRILDKPGKLTDEEWKIMKTHTINGYNILRSADKYSRLAEYALTHHERWDGSGYPNGLQGEDIPLFSRIINICDSYEAMTADRPYRKAPGKDFAIRELKRCAGSQFDAKLVDVFIHQSIINDI